MIKTLSITFDLLITLQWKSLACFFYLQFCENQSGRLAVINSEKTQKDIEAYLDKVDPEGDNYFWIGLTDISHEGNFAWITDEPVNYTNWLEGEPNNLGNNEHFAQLWIKVDHQRRWNDEVNNDGVAFALCQFGSGEQEDE